MPFFCRLWHDFVNCCTFQESISTFNLFSNIISNGRFCLPNFQYFWKSKWNLIAWLNCCMIANSLTWRKFRFKQKAQLNLGRKEHLLFVRWHWPDKIERSICSKLARCCVPLGDSSGLNNGGRSPRLDLRCVPPKAFDRASITTDRYKVDIFQCSYANS